MLRSSLSLSRPVFKIVAEKFPSAGARPVRIHTLSIAKKRPALNFKPLVVANKQYASGSPPYDKLDRKAEEEVAKKTLEARSEEVSTKSNVPHVFEQRPEGKEDSDANMGGGLESDLKTVYETFALKKVPRESYYLGAAGVLPYAATSLSTVYLTYDISHAQANDNNGILISPETAYQMLKIIEPIQIGYGAVIISFLGAIHWGLEYAGYGGYHGYRRFAIGVVAPAVAWPTLLMPVEIALTTQFLAFVSLYFIDARASVRGWAPPWYSLYRFVLTFFVGGSIVISLIGRGQITAVTEDTDGAFHVSGMSGPTAGMRKFKDGAWDNLAQEEKESKAEASRKDEERKAKETNEDEEKEKNKKEGQKKKNGDDKKGDNKGDEG